MHEGNNMDIMPTLKKPTPESPSGGMRPPVQPGAPCACPHAAHPAAARGRPPVLLELGDDPAF